MPRQDTPTHGNNFGLSLFGLLIGASDTLLWAGDGFSLILVSLLFYSTNHTNNIISITFVVTFANVFSEL
jgi:hypothetical protein